MDGLLHRVSLFAASAALLLIAVDPSAATTFAITINDLSAAASPLRAGATTTVNVDATDSGGALSYTWSTSGGSISGSGASITWQAPASAGTYTITCTVVGPSGNPAVLAGREGLPDLPRRPRSRSGPAPRQPELDHRRPDLHGARDAVHRDHQRRVEVRVLRGKRELVVESLPREAGHRLEQQLRRRNDNLVPAAQTLITCIVDGRTTADNMNTYILESPTLTGPFKLITYLRDFGPQDYFCNFPSKFIGGDGKSAWMWYSANFHPLERPNGGDPVGSGYHLCTLEVLLQRPVHSNPLSGGTTTPPTSTPAVSTPPPSTSGSTPPASPSSSRKGEDRQICGMGSAALPDLTALPLAALLALALLGRRR